MPRGAVKRPVARPVSNRSPKSTGLKNNDVKIGLDVDPEEIHRPAYARFFIQALDSHVWDGLRKKAENGQTITLNIFSDTCGMTTEMFSAYDLRPVLKELIGADVVFRLYIACEKDKSCASFTKKAHSPTHFSNDIYDRNFESGTFKCTLCNAEHSLPTTGIDIYFAGAGDAYLL